MCIKRKKFTHAYHYLSGFRINPSVSNGAVIMPVLDGVCTREDLRVCRFPIIIFLGLKLYIRINNVIYN